jgi:glutamate-1-semialdehyde 2,1-aminomutase
MAESFLSLVPQHDMIKYAKNGSVVSTAAIKLARAFTGRNIVARTAEHPFYSYDDWFIGSTDCDFGVPRDVKNMTITFKHNDLEDLERMFNEYPGQIACIIGEPEKWEVIEPDFYKKAIEIAHKHGALWIMDEMITGFKTDYPGSIKSLNADPDMSTWGKGIANGFSFCALTGKKEVMELGGIKNQGDKKLFLVSTTHGGETTAIAAGLATMKIFEQNNVVDHNKKIGQYFINGVSKIISENHVEDYFLITGFNWNVGLIVKNQKKEPCMFYRTLFMQEMIKRGVLYQGILSPCFSMTKNDIDLMLEAFNDSVIVFKQALELGYQEFLIGSEIKPVFRKYN